MGSNDGVGADQRLEDLVAAILGSTSYGTISRELIISVGERELRNRRSLKEAIKATKSKLHQVGGAYFSRSDYTAWLGELEAAAQTGSREELRVTCRKIMGSHASTRERLPILDEFYTTILGQLPPVRRVLDIACGLNPLALPWMPLAEGAEYHAYDIYADLTDFLSVFLGIVGVHGQAQARDVIQRCPSEHADLALVLKALPCLEQLDKTASARLLDSLDADHILVSFPVASLGGRRKGMEASYEARFQQLVSGKGWSVTRFAFATELAFLIQK